MKDEATIRSVFVYGTLKRGQCRESLWPVRPVAITPAWTRGTLFSRHDYPAMTGGNDRVRGECWQFDAERIAEVMRCLDVIEGANQPGTRDLYRRVIVELSDADGGSLGLAFGYHYAIDPTQDGFVPVRPDAPDRDVAWPS
tara:strand:+ start:201689 stop:202111 length:423 start_codon:yes stop_codon:yes gene_type:complete